MCILVFVHESRSRGPPGRPPSPAHDSAPRPAGEAMGTRYDRRLGVPSDQRPSDGDRPSTLPREGERRSWPRSSTASMSRIGPLPSTSTIASGYTVSPFVGVIPDALDLRADPHEVAEIFSVPLEVLRDPSFRGQYAWKRAGELAHFPAILYGGQTIWGLTLRITETMLQLLGKPNP